MHRFHVLLFLVCFREIKSMLQISDIKSRGGYLVWMAEAESVSGESHGWDVSYVACQSRAMVEHILSNPVHEWIDLPERDVSDCRRLCRVRQYTFSILDGTRCYCSRRYAAEQMLESGYCEANCRQDGSDGRQKNKKQTTTTPTDDFILQLEEQQEKRKHYELEFTWNRRFCGNNPYLITYSVCPHYLWGASCEQTCMCQSKYCDVAIGLCLGTRCLEGFGGARCNEYDFCHDNPCENGGECINMERAGTYTCKCRYGFYGEKCEKSIEKEQVSIESQSIDSPEIFKGVPNFHLLGCFRLPSGRGHLFSDNFLLQTNIMTIQVCLKHCTSLNFTLASLIKGNQCRCANYYDTFVSVAEEECRLSCHGDVKQLCGGISALHIYSLCPMGFYGLKACDKECHCEYRNLCHVVTGACPNKCARGYTGRRCDIMTWSLENLLTFDNVYILICFLFFLFICFGISIAAGTYLVNKQ